MTNSPFIPTFALRHKRDFILMPSRHGGTMTFPSYEAANEFRDKLVNGDKWRAVKLDAATGQYV